VTANVTTTSAALNEYLRSTLLIVSTDERTVREDDGVELDMQIDGVGKQRVLLVDKLTEELIVVLVPIALPMDHESVGLNTSLTRFESRWMVAEDDVTADHLWKTRVPPESGCPAVSVGDAPDQRQTHDRPDVFARDNHSMGFSLRPTSAIRSPNDLLLMDRLRSRLQPVDSL